MNKNNQSGKANVFLIATILLLLTTVTAGAFAFWAYSNYVDQKTDVDARVDSAVAIAQKTQADNDEAKFAEREKSPYREFVGPDDYGRVTFSYPKTWSVYVSNDSESGGGQYQAYFNPIIVPAVNGTEKFALRVTISQQEYAAAIASYDGLIQTGELKSVPVTVDGSTGTRIDGAFTPDLRGSLVLFKIRDKVLEVRTDANTFTADFDTLVASIKFNQ